MPSHVAANDAARRRHEYITVEHLLYALLLDETTANVVRHAGGDPAALKKQLEKYLDEQLEPLAEDGRPTPTPLARRPARHPPRRRATCSRAARKR